MGRSYNISFEKRTNTLINDSNYFILKNARKVLASYYTSFGLIVPRYSNSIRDNLLLKKIL